MTDPVLIRAGHAVVEPHGSEATAYVCAHLFEHNPDVRKLSVEHLNEQRNRLRNTLGTLLTHLDDTDTVAPGR